MLKTTSQLYNHGLAIKFKKENMIKSPTAMLKRAIAKIAYGNTSVTNFDKALAFAEKHPENHYIFYPPMNSPLYDKGLCIVRRSPYRSAEYDRYGILRHITKCSDYAVTRCDVVDRTYKILIPLFDKSIMMKGQCFFNDLLSGTRKIKEIFDNCVKDWNGDALSCSRRKVGEIFDGTVKDWKECINKCSY